MGNDKRHIRIAVFLGMAALLAVAMTSCRKEFKSGLPVVTLHAKGAKIKAEVAATQESRTTGLMFRRELCRDCGMLFAFPDPVPLSFWMRNTYLPLSVAFLDKEGTILNIEDMEPLTETTHRSKGPARYALEMGKGWFAKKGVQPGDAVEGLSVVLSVAE